MPHACQGLAAVISQMTRVPRGDDRDVRLCDLALGYVRDLLGFDTGVVVTAGDEQRPAVVVNHGVDADYTRHLVEHYAAMPGMDAVRTGKILAFGDVREVEGFRAALPVMEQVGIRAIVILPMRDLGEELIGALVVYHSEVRLPSSEQLEAAEAAVGYASTTMANERLRRTRELLLRQTLIEESNDVIGALTAGIAHDFNNLLGAFHSFLDYLPRMQAGEVEGMRRWLSAQLDSATALSRQLVELVRSGAPGSDTGQAEVVGTLNNVLTLVRGSIPADLDLTLDSTEKSMWARIDAQALSRVAINLLLNASHALAGRHDGRVIIEIQRQDRRCVISIDDNGPGIAEGDEEAIFEPFVSVAKESGTGLGLASARGILERAGGSLRLVHREGPGACFRITLPLAPGDSAGVAAEPTAEAGRDPGVQRRALVAEDEIIQRTVFAHVLEDAGFAVDAVEDGEAATELLLSETYDLVVLDHSLPKRTGAEVLGGLRAKSRELPVLVVSGYGVHADFVAAHTGPHTRVLAKPVGGEMLLAAVDQLLDDNR